MSVKNNKDASQILKQFEIVATTNMVARSWSETSTVIWNCFCKAGFKCHGVDPYPQPEEPPVFPASDVWQKVQRWMDVNFDYFATNEPEASTTELMTDKDIIDLVHTENDTPQEESEDEEEDIPPARVIKSTNEFLVIVNNQQKAFLTKIICLLNF